MTNPASSETIQFDRKLAEEMQRELSDLMQTYTDNSSGSDYYLCPFCNRYSYVSFDHRNHSYVTEPIQHGPDCLGMKMMKELDLRLNEKPACATTEACEGFLMVHGVSHGTWCPLHSLGPKRGGNRG